MIIYQLNRFRRNSFDNEEELVAFYESFQDAYSHKKNDESIYSNYEYCIYNRTVISAKENRNV